MLEMCYVITTEADFLCTKMAEKINNKMEHRMIKEQHLVLLASIEVDLLTYLLVSCIL